jgi:ferredoxin
MTMTQIEERSIAGLIIRIDRTLCVGFGDCVDLAPEAFVLDDEGIAVMLPEIDIARERLIEACDACPVDAITVLAEDGQQIVP